MLLLSWYIVVVGTAMPWAARKCLVHSTWPIASLMATSSASVELFELIFCLHGVDLLHDVEYTTPIPSILIDIAVWLPGGGRSGQLLQAISLLLGLN